MKFVITFIIFLFSSHAFSKEYNCDAAVVFAWDTSYSVDDSEYDLQKNGTAEALRSDQFRRFIHLSTFRLIYIAVLEWDETQRVQIDWTPITTLEDAQEVANLISSLTRYSKGMTGLARGIKASGDLFKSVPCTAFKNVIDVSGDGKENVDSNGRLALIEARNSLPHWIELNGLAVTNEVPDLDEYYRDTFVTGFVMQISSYSDFSEAMRRKFILEISNTNN